LKAAAKELEEEKKKKTDDTQKVKLALSNERSQRQHLEKELDRYKNSSQEKLENEFSKTKTYQEKYELALKEIENLQSQLNRTKTETESEIKVVRETAEKKLEIALKAAAKELEEEKKKTAKEIKDLRDALEEAHGQEPEPEVVEVKEMLQVDEDEEEPETEVFARLLGDDMKTALDGMETSKRVPSRAEISRLLKVWLAQEKVQSLVGESLVSLVRETHKENVEVQSAVDSYNHKRETSLPLLEMNMGHEIIISGIVAWLYIMLGGLLYWRFERDNEVLMAKSAGHDIGLWRPASSAFFALTVVSTIGYGATAPKTFYGRMTLVPYAIVGIPIFNYFLSRISKVINKAIVLLTSSILECFTTAHRKYMFGHGGFNWFKSMTLFVETGTALILGSLLFVHYEGWSFFDSVYFSFVTVSTIGFGDMVPETDPTRALATVYIVLFEGSMSGLLNEMENLYGISFDKLVRVTWGMEKEEDEVKQAKESSSDADEGASLLSKNSPVERYDSFEKHLTQHVTKHLVAQLNQLDEIELGQHEVDTKEKEVSETLFGINRKPDDSWQL